MLGDNVSFFCCCCCFYNCIVPLGFLPRKIRVAFSRESHLRQSRATQSMVHAGCFSVSIIHRTLDMDSMIFNVRSDVNACDCTRGSRDARNAVWEKNPLPHRRIEPASAAWRSDALPTELHPIPIVAGRLYYRAVCREVLSETELSEGGRRGKYI